MAVLTKSAGGDTDFQPCPAGDFQGVVADIVDLGHIEKKFEGVSQGLKPHVQVVYQVVGTDDDDNPVVRDDGKPYLVFGRRCVLSMHERSALYREICGILGKSVVDSELDAGTLDTENLIERNVNLTVIHNTAQDGKTYANIENCKPWNKKYGAPQSPRDYQRRCERDDWEQKKPLVSAFDPLPSEPDEWDNATPAPIAAAPVASPPQASQAPQSQTIAPATMNAVNVESERIWGTSYALPRDTWKSQLHGALAWRDMTPEQGAQALDTLRRMKAAAPAVAVEDDFDDADPFENQ